MDTLRHYYLGETSDHGSCWGYTSNGITVRLGSKHYAEPICKERGEKCIQLAELTDDEKSDSERSCGQEDAQLGEQSIGFIDFLVSDKPTFAAHIQEQCKIRGVVVEPKTMVARKSLIDEGAMPKSVIQAKERIRNMTDDEKKEYFKGHSKEKLLSRAWSHGYGKGSTQYAKYWDGETE